MSNITKSDKPRLIRGVLLKCNDGQWKDGDGLTPPSELLVVGTAKGLQCWGKDNDLLDVVLETPGEPLPDAAELNAKIPQNEWGTDLTGKPRPPWQLNHVVYLIDMETASTFTYLNSTAGARIAVERLAERIANMRFMRGNAVAPIVRLDSRPMRTSFGTKQRPEFTIVDWRDLGGNGPAPVMLEHKGSGDAALQIEHRPAAPEPEKQPTVAQERIGPDVIKRPGKPAQKDGIGKKVKPPSVAEEIDDGLPGDLAPPDNPLQAG
jgi:hypothetical protein